MRKNEFCSDQYCTFFFFKFFYFFFCFFVPINTLLVKKIYIDFWKKIFYFFFNSFCSNTKGC
ncbi:TPA: hypothetical protein DIC38_02295 [Candidatus Nomurabacteria bacterium]|nr:hypothetical protein [Candidatus Nomurabacteria bacterium]